MSVPQSVPQSEDFDAAVDTFLAGAAPATQDAPAEEAAPPVVEAARPATETQPQATTATEDDDSDDEALPVDTRFLRAQKREERLKTEKQEALAKAEAEERKAWSHHGNLLQEQKRREALQADRDKEKARAEAAEARRAKDWDEAINLAPETTDQPGVATKARLRELRDQELHESQLASREQRITQVEEREQQQAQETKAKAARDARVYAVGEHYLKSAAWEAEDAVPEGTYQPVRDFLMQPAHRALANSLPLVPLGEHERIKPPGDPLSWQLDQLPDLHSFYLYLQANSNAARDFYKRDHAEKQTKAEQERVTANAQQASKTYQPEKPIGTAGGPSRRSFEEMDFDEAVDAFFPHP